MGTESDTKSHAGGSAAGVRHEGQMDRSSAKLNPQRRQITQTPSEKSRSRTGYPTGQVGHRVSLANHRTDAPQEVHATTTNTVVDENKAGCSPGSAATATETAASATAGEP